MSKPVIVLVPGSFAKAYFYSGVADKLSEYGYETDTVELPSCGRRDPAPAATMADDAAAIQSVTRKYIDQGKTVLVCTHSYGGIPGTESIKGLATTTRKSNGLKGGVSRIVYVTSVVVPVGQSLKDGMGDNLPDYLIVDGDYMHHDVDRAAKVTFSDLPEAEAVEWVKKMPEHSAPSFNDPLTYPGYRDVDLSWIFCDEDLVIPPQAQQAMIDFIEKDTGKTVDVHHIKTGHAPQASHPGLVADVTRKIAEGTS